MTRTAMTGIPQPTTGPVALLIGTPKGAFIVKSDHPRRKWNLSSPILLGHIAKPGICPGYCNRPA